MQQKLEVYECHSPGPRLGILFAVLQMTREYVTAWNLKTNRRVVLAAKNFRDPKSIYRPRRDLYAVLDLSWYKKPEVKLFNRSSNQGESSES